MPEEPAKGSEDSLEIVFRLPNGKRNNRIFMKTDKIALLYNYINYLQVKKQCQIDEEDDDDTDDLENDLTNYSDKYQIIQTMPRKIFDDKEIALD